VIYGAELGRRIELGRGVFEIGRSAKCDLSLEEDSVSRHHARIVVERGHGYALHDVGSTNGVYVNDVRVQNAVLRNGDQLRIGRTILKFMTGSSVEAHYHDEVYRLMTVDGLTKTYNKRYFDEALERECNRAKRHKRPLSLVLLDIDHFKQKNDTYGHISGDSILRQLAAAVGPRLRREDIFARVGGEEFAILLPEVGLTGARVTAEKVRRLVEITPFDLDGEVVHCTVSAGYAAFDPAGTPTSFYAAADQAMYRAKSAGRNRAMG
jgi:diguanylate cyclase (GGDEF)-like protein